MDHRATLASSWAANEDDPPTITLTDLISSDCEDTCPSLFDRSISDLGGPADPNQMLC